MPAKTFESSNAEHYRRVADLYRDAVERGSSGPCAEIAAQLGVPAARVRTWVHKARQRGFLGGAIGRTPGEQDERFLAHEGKRFAVAVVDALDGFVARLELVVDRGSPVLDSFTLRRDGGPLLLTEHLRAVPLHRWVVAAIAAAGRAADEGVYEAVAEVDL